MGQEDRAAVIAGEQRAVDHAYRCLERNKNDQKRLSESPAGASTKDNAAQRREFLARAKSHEDLANEQLVFARVEVVEGDERRTFCLGRLSGRFEAPQALCALLETAASSDREDNLHEAVRHGLLSVLYKSERNQPHQTDLADIVVTAPDSSILYEVLGEGGHTYAGMREGVLRAMEVRQAGGLHADHTFLVLPRPPAEPWAVEVVSQMSGFSVIWQTDEGWDGQRIDVALGKEA